MRHHNSDNLIIIAHGKVLSDVSPTVGYSFIIIGDDFISSITYLFIAIIAHDFKKAMTQCNNLVKKPYLTIDKQMVPVEHEVRIVLGES